MRCSGNGNIMEMLLVEEPRVGLLDDGTEPRVGWLDSVEARVGSLYGQELMVGSLGGEEPWVGSLNGGGPRVCRLVI
jgi:hypothetical protein